MNAKKLMRVVGGEHDGATVEIEDYGWAVRLPLQFTPEEIAMIKEGKEPAQRYQLYYRSAVTLQDDDGTVHQIEFLRPGNLTVRQAVETRLLPEPTPGSKLS